VNIKHSSNIPSSNFMYTNSKVDVIEQKKFYCTDVWLRLQQLSSKRGIRGETCWWSYSWQCGQFNNKTAQIKPI